jgi:DNA-directed RNA polymerase subunit RPC12/RpoP
MDDKRFREAVENSVTDPDGDRRYGNSERPVALSIGKRIEVEFWCTNCSHYIYVKINTGLEGNHIVVCPNCHHKHYRFVQSGVITGDRWNEGSCVADEIIPMKSAAVPEDQRRVRGCVSILREMEACGLLR